MSREGENLANLRERNKRVIKDLGRIPCCAGEQEYPEKPCLRAGILIDSKGFFENSGLGKGIFGKTPGFIREIYSLLERVWSVTSRL
jgi:hypothetical protein